VRTNKLISTATATLQIPLTPRVVFVLAAI
jgi:hypothetical protein